jgi:hypothetical protein
VCTMDWPGPVICMYVCVGTVSYALRPTDPLVVAIRWLDGFRMRKVGNTSIIGLYSSRVSVHLPETPVGPGL